MRSAALVAVTVLLGTRAPAASGATRSATHCLDSFLAVGAPVARPADIAQGRVSKTSPDYIIRTDLLVAPDVAGEPIVGYLYISHGGNAFFSTRVRRSIAPGAAPLIREIYAASTTATSAELDALLAHQNGNAVVFLPRALKLLRGLHLRAARCVVLPKTVKPP